MELYLVFFPNRLTSRPHISMILNQFVEKTAQNGTINFYSIYWLLWVETANWTGLDHKFNFRHSFFNAAFYSFLFLFKLVNLSNISSVTCFHLLILLKWWMQQTSETSLNNRLSYSYDMFWFYGKVVFRFYGVCILVRSAIHCTQIQLSEVSFPWNWIFSFSTLVYKLTHRCRWLDTLGE